MGKNFLTLILVIFSLVVLPATFFITTPKVRASHSRVSLGTANNFAVLAGSAISDTGTTHISGDVGLSPTGGASITGLTCAEVGGTIYDTNGGYAGGGGGSTACLSTNAALLTTAKDALITAYDDAAGRTTTSTIATELGGTTLTDGTYDSSAGTFGITGTVTLNGQGNADSVFIFKMASTLITASSSRVVLTNGAQACNVYWQVGSSATLGTSTNLIGNVLALTSITDDGSSTVNGRLLARNAAVTLNNTNITTANCDAGTAGAAASTTSSSSSSSTSSSSGSSTVCPAVSYIAPIIIESRRVDGDSIFLSWGPYSGINTFKVQYGFENGVWLYSTNVTGFSTTLNSLPTNTPIWVRIAATDGCSVGTYGIAVLVGASGSTGNFLIPLLPNTGLNPDHNNLSWGSAIPVAFVMLASTLVFVFRKSHT